MPLLDLMWDSPSTVDKFTIEQAVAMAGDGDVRDASDCSGELREYLSRISSEKLFDHINHCLSSSFTNSGFVLQDIANELGRRLGYTVDHGVYRGKKNTINFDGLWKEPLGSQIMVEVKTSDAYRINLDNLAEYRNSLIDDSIISETSSILLIVGREDTGDLEAQIRGSKHAWHTRVISAESLVNLVKIKENSDEDLTVSKIRSLLTPFEYTRLDNIIDIMFTATKDVETSLESNILVDEIDNSAPNTPSDGQRHTPPQTMDELRKVIISTLSEKENINLIAHKRAQFWTPEHEIRAACTVSKRYEGTSNYWYAYHPQWDEFLDAAKTGYFVLGCLDKRVAYVLPHAEISSCLSDLNATTPDNGKTYWHIKLEDDVQHGMSLILRGDGRRKVISHFRMELTPSINSSPNKKDSRKFSST